MLRKDHFGEDNDGAIEAAVSGLTPKVRQNNHGKSLQTSKADVERVFAAPGKECGIPSLKVPRAGGLVYRETGGHGTRTKSGASQSVGPAVLPGSAHVQGTGAMADACSAVASAVGHAAKARGFARRRRRLFDPNLT